MKHNIFWRTMRRQPVRNGILLLLVALMSALLVSRGAEYIWIREQIDTAESYYRSVGTLSTYDPNASYITDAVPVIEESKYVDHSSVNSFQFATFDNIQNSLIMGAGTKVSREGDRSRGLTSSDIMLYGTVQEVTYSSQQRIAHRETDSTWNTTFSYHPSAKALQGVDMGAWKIKLLVDKVEVGYDNYVEAGQTASITFYPRNFPNLADSYEAPEVGQRYFLKVFFEPEDSYFERGSPDTEEFYFFRLSPFFDGRWMVQLNEGEEIDWNAPENQTLKKELDTIDYFTRAVQLIATTDMLALPFFQEINQSAYLLEGRWLDYKDHESGKPVCVIHSRLAEVQGVKLGDTLELTVHDYIAEESYLSAPDVLIDGSRKTMSFDVEVVGIYSYAGELADVYALHEYNIYVPKSLTSDAFDAYRPEVPWGDRCFGFVLTSPRVQHVFEEEYTEKLAQMGYQLMFVENHFQTFYDSAKPLLQSAMISFMVFLGLFLLSMILITLLYTRPRRRELAILQAMGVPRKQAVMQLLMPMLCVGGGCTAIGGCIGWIWAMQHTKDMVMQLRSEVELDGALSVFWLLILLLCAVCVLAFFVWLLARKAAGKPVLEQLQGGSR